MYIVSTSNIEGDCEFERLENALNFIRDQIKMGFPCSIKAPPKTITIKSHLDTDGIESLAFKLVVEREDLFRWYGHKLVEDDGDNSYWSKYAWELVEG